MTGNLYHSPAEIVTQLIIDLGLANDPDDGANPATGWMCFATHFPEEPDQAMAVMDTAGRQHHRLQTTGVKGEHYGIQVLARSANGAVASYKKMKAILEAFDDQVRRNEVDLWDSDNQVYREYRINAITRTSAAIPSGMDGRRYLYSGNAIASIEMTETQPTGTGTI